MKNYIIQKGDTFVSLAQKFGLKDGSVLRNFHNLHCAEEDIMHQEPIPGKVMLIVEDPQFMAEEILPDDVSENSEAEYFAEPSNNTSCLIDSKDEHQSQSDDNKEDQVENDKNSSSHEGKYFIIQKGTAQCNQGFRFPKFKVTSHQKLYWNDAEGQEDYLAVTEDDLQFDPSVQPFGQCQLKPSSGGYLPCAYAPAGKWQKAYENVKVLEKKCLTELSELMCCMGGTITVLKHGQQSEISRSQASSANTQELQVYNPVVNYDEFKEYINDRQYFT